MKARLAGFLLTISAMLLGAAPVQAALHIDITSGNIQPVPIAINDLIAADPSAAQVGREISDVVAADLERSGLFRPIDKGAFIERISSGNAIPHFPDWRQINAQGLVTGTITMTSDGRMRVGFRLWDVLGETQIAGKEFNSVSTNWRRIAHLVADEIYKRITGEQGYFDSRIVYVAESGSFRRRVKRLAIMDQDSANHKFLTDGSQLVLTPRFSPNTQEILYMSYAGRQPRVYLRDLQTGQEESLGHFEGMSFAPQFANDGHHVIMSIAHGGSTQIYTMDLRNRHLHKLTDTGNAINTSPSYSPDGSKIVFNSDRGGSQQLYTMNADGSNVTRISFGDGRYGTPVWSPRGDKIAFTKMAGGEFYIGVMNVDGSGERELDHSYFEEGPTWSPNGRVIMFYRQSRGHHTRLYSVDLTGRNVREVPTPLDASDPAWSPRLSK
ncbi:MAG TPA: Tol-Pal system beta propeller repeat protein TolB [Rickettsiales bacterium]|nr:Tol-Pal system beta propeller repeat protein TolB [Rickettsiales bacterium]